MDSKQLLSKEAMHGIAKPIKTLRSAIYYHVRESIINHKYNPNQRIHEKDIASEFGVSTTPVREAFLKLESEGFLKINEHQGVIIRPLSYTELIELYEVIGVLDGFAHLLAINHIDEKKLAEIKAYTTKMEKLYNNDMIEEYLHVNGQLHSFIWDISSNVKLKLTLENTYGQILRYRAERLLLCSKPEIIENSMDGHRKIVCAFENRDTENIEMTVRNHWSISGFKSYSIEMSELKNLINIRNKIS
jgi:DNA-binding GntR family transcriptional regulator